MKDKPRYSHRGAYANESNCAYYAKPVADVCLNCTRPDCNAGCNGCDTYLAAVKAAANQAYNRGKKKGWRK